MEKKEENVNNLSSAEFSLRTVKVKLCLIVCSFFSVPQKCK